jgi:hypothetical protein
MSQHREKRPMTTTTPSEPKPPAPDSHAPSDTPAPSFAETALTLGGKSADEAQRMGAIDRADDQVEQLFKAQYQTTNSPIHRAVWDAQLPVELFEAAYESTPPDVQQVMSASLHVVRKHVAAKTLHNNDGKIADACWPTSPPAIGVCW